MIRIHIFRCGATVVDEALPLANKSKNPFAYTGIARVKKHKIEVPVTAYLIEHPKGLIYEPKDIDYCILTHMDIDHAGDSGYCRESWEKQILPGVMWNKEKALQSLKKLSTFSRDENCIAILATHDSEVRQSVIEL